MTETNPSSAQPADDASGAHSNLDSSALDSNSQPTAYFASPGATPVPTSDDAPGVPANEPGSQPPMPPDTDVNELNSAPMSAPD